VATSAMRETLVTNHRRRYALAMDESRYDREVGEQLAEALPVLGQAALRHATEGIRSLLAACPNPTHQKLMIWLWAVGYERFGPVSLASKGAGFRFWFTDGGADFVVAVGDVEVPVWMDPVKVRRGEMTVNSKQIEAQPRSTASALLDHLAKLVAKEHRKADKQETPRKKTGAKEQPKFVVRPVGNPRHKSAV
jgi:hypothetical protein